MKLTNVKATVGSRLSPDPPLGTTRDRLVLSLAMSVRCPNVYAGSHHHVALD